MKKQDGIMLFAVVLLLAATASAGSLVHHYDFKESTPGAGDFLADKVAGGTDLTMTGSGVTVTGDGRAVFTDTSSFLSADIDNLTGSYVVSFWFNADPDINDGYSAMFSSKNAKDPYTWQVDFLNITGGTTKDIRLTSSQDGNNESLGDKSLITDPTSNTWHHIAILSAPSWSNKTQVWADGGAVTKYSASVGDLVMVLLGINRAGNDSFTGALANVKIYDGTDWNDAAEAAEWAAGPGVSTVTPYNPQPADGSVMPKTTTEFTWQAGDPDIMSYNVYFGLPGSLGFVENYPVETVPVADIASALGGGFIPGGEYQWQVESLDASDAVLGTGNIWTVYMPAVGDNFYAYNTASDLKQVWDDGSVNGTGATISLPGVALPTNQGSHWGFIRPLGIMQIDYDNNAVLGVSEVDLEFDYIQNFQGTGYNTLSLSYQGQETNHLSPLYLIIRDGASTVTFNSPLPDDVTSPWWKTWNIRFADIQAAGIDLTHITSMTIGIGDGVNPAVGTVFIDDLELNFYDALPKYQPAGDIDDSYRVDIDDFMLIVADWLFEDYAVTASEPLSGLQGFYAFNETGGSTASDDSSNGFHAEVNTSTQWDAGGIDGTGCLIVDDSTEVTLPIGVMSGVSGQMTVSMWIWALGLEYPNQVNTVSLQSGNALSRQAMDYAAWPIASDGQYDGWNHYAVVKDTAAGQTRFYHNGILVAVQTGQTEAVSGTESLVLKAPAEGSMVKVDNLKIYNTALTQEQIVYLAGGSSHQVTQPITPLMTEADIYEDGRIDLKDMAVLSQNWLLEY